MLSTSYTGLWLEPLLVHQHRSGSFIVAAADVEINAVRFSRRRYLSAPQLTEIISKFGIGNLAKTEVAGFSEFWQLCRFSDYVPKRVRRRLCRVLKVLATLPFLSKPVLLLLCHF